MSKISRLASFWSWADWFESYLVANPVDMFSPDEAHMTIKSFSVYDEYYHLIYPNDPKISDRYAWANGADPDQTEQSDQDLHCFPFCLHCLDS